MDLLPQRKIIHVDMDAFYASVEQRDNPDLRGQPVAVGGSRQRGVVAAASYEARQFGVRSAMASSVAIRKCPDLLFVKPRFDVYKTVSNQIRAVFAAYTDLIEPLSLDEAYLDVTASVAEGQTATQLAQTIKERIKEETGLTASAGVSYNKFLAKLASDYRKPDGLFVIRPHQGLAFVETLAVGQFHGIGQVTAARMNQLGIFTGLDLRQQSEAFLCRHFGKVGQHYYSIARGVDERPVTANRVRKSVGSENTFEQDLTEYLALTAGLQPLIDDVWSYYQRTGVSGRTVTLKVKYADFQQITRSRTVVSPVADRALLERIILELLNSLLPLAKGVRLLGVSMSGLQAADAPADGQLRLNL
ncbi:DNA polymerase IV [Spirosoma utsteinense]|uniref:DNA polymerase IV n=1 Tax=Spirosoma utsteinense TaxID=2585773 RepID=A0ABR6W600_9BACT|nr:DNA polymerase IV [Spirosoma utsteinense]MBC3786344.1 DNA polymerase-4 [Spirosoma utsteinense]MBC3791970.1 DNA polymerase-4 [Spirosoma utsteinense]